MMKYRMMVIVSISAMLGSALVGCGDSNGGVGHMKTHDRNITKNDFDVETINWEYVKPEGLKVHESASDLYIAFEHNSTQPNMQFFIDADSNPKTGHPLEGGADYVVENGYLYAYTNENVWGWKEVSIVKTSVQKNQMDAVEIPRNLLPTLGTTFRVNVQALGKDWLPVVYLPTPLGEKYSYPQ